MAFKFKLESLLKLKIQMENNIKTKLGKAIKRVEFEKSNLRTYESEKRMHQDKINIESAKGIKLSKLKEYINYTSVLSERIENQKEVIKKARENVDKYREELIKAMHARKTMEKLKEKKREAYFKEQIKKEQIINDEVTSFKYSKE